MKEPIVSEDGTDSEHFARTCKLRTVYRCGECDFQCGALGKYEPEPRDPPELRDLAAWKQAALAQKARLEFDRIKAMARRTYDAHECKIATEDAAAESLAKANDELWRLARSVGK